MGGRPVRIEWRDEEGVLFRRYHTEGDPELRTRWHGLWLVHRGTTLRQAAWVLAVDERSVRRWVAWYRRGGLAEVARHRRGRRAGRPPRLAPEQQARLLAEAGQGAFRTAEEAARWVEQRFGVRYTPWGIYALLRRLGWRPKVPRPVAAKADPAAQAAWKGGAWLPR